MKERERRKRKHILCMWTYVYVNMWALRTWQRPEPSVRYHDFIRPMQHWIYLMLWLPFHSPHHRNLHTIQNFLLEGFILLLFWLDYSSALATGVSKGSLKHDLKMKSYHRSEHLIPSESQDTHNRWLYSQMPSQDNTRIWSS